MKRSTHTPLLTMAALLLAILACQAFGAAPPVTEPPVVDTVVPAPTNTEAPPPPTEVSTQASAPQYFTDEFDTDSGLWSHFVIDASIQLTSPGSLPQLATGDAGNMSVKVEDSHLSFDLQSKGLWVYATYDGAEYSDVRMDVVADNRGTNDNNVSLVCRYSKEHGWYEFNVANNGLYDILYGHYTPDGKVIYGRIADGGSNKIKQGKQINTYGIICKGRQLVLSINGFETRRIDDNQYVLDSGKVGVSVSSFNSLPVIVSFDSVKISEP